MASSENSSSPDHSEVVDLEAGIDRARSNANPNVGNGGDENSTELDPERNGVVVVNMPETRPGADASVIVVVYGNGTQVRRVHPSHDDHNFSSYNLIQIALAFWAQLTAVFVGNVINKPPSPCSCSCSCSSSHSHSHSSDYNSAAVTVAGISLVGFVVTLISMSTAKMRAAISSPIAKFGFAAAASVVIISVGLTLPLHAKGKIAVSVAACLPALVAIARA